MNARRLSRAIAALLLATLLLTLATAKGRDPALYPAPPGQGVTIYLVDNGWHSDLAVPTTEIEARGGALALAARATSSGPWMLIGWGDARFYEAATSATSRIPDGVSALIGGRPTVLHLEGAAGPPDASWDEDIRPITLSRPGLEALLVRAESSLAHDATGAPIMAPIHRVPNEAFFISTERFSLAHLCNHWTAQLLNAAGVPVTPVLDTLPGGLRLDLKLRAGV